jgi:hypothetical protein
MGGPLENPSHVPPGPPSPTPLRGASGRGLTGARGAQTPAKARGFDYSGHLWDIWVVEAVTLRRPRKGPGLPRSLLIEMVNTMSNSDNGVSLKDLQAQIAALKAELATAKEKKVNFSVKVSEKGGISLYGLQRFPVTLYAAQWMAILNRKDELVKFMQDNKDRLATKE